MAPQPKSAPTCRAVGVALRLLLVTVVFQFPHSLTAQTPNADVRTVYGRVPQVTVPFTLQPGARIKHAELYYSTDQGRTWQFHAYALPNETRFREFVAPGDGQYWFAVRSIDLAEQAYPQTLQQLEPSLRVIIDRRAPQIYLRAVSGQQPDMYGVEWDIRDENLDVNRFQLESRVPGVTEWRQEQAPAKASGVQYWQNFRAGTKLEVRLRAGDRAGNENEQTLVLSHGADARQGDPFPGNQGNASAQSNIHYINNKNFQIPFKLSNVGVSGISVRELWYTRDNGRNWQRAPKSGADSVLPTNPGENAPNDRFPSTADADGLYGFSVVVRSGVGLGDHDPRPGDPARMNIEVDTVMPKVDLFVKRGQGADIRNVTIEWQASDKNLGDRPVTLLYKEKDGDWKSIIGEQEARGSYTWVVPEQGPFQFLIQARASDKAGNVGTAATNEQITVDASLPKADLQAPIAGPGGGR